MKLKTLKDISNKRIMKLQIGYSGKLLEEKTGNQYWLLELKDLIKKDIRQEAIKWFHSSPVQGAYPDEGMSAYDFIIEFFNLNEEDLK